MKRIKNIDEEIQKTKTFVPVDLKESNDKTLKDIISIEIAVGRYLGHCEEGNLVREVYMHLYPEKEDSIMNKMLDNI